MTYAKICVAVLIVVSSAMAANSDRKYIPAPGAAKSLPISAAVEVGNTLYISGHIGTKNEQERLAPADEVHALMDKLKQTVESAGYSLDDIVSVQIFCTDMKLYDTFNSAYATYFHGQFPARAFIGINQLTRGAHFEVTAIAVKKSAK